VKTQESVVPREMGKEGGEETYQFGYSTRSIKASWEEGCFDEGIDRHNRVF
jgi:hypothetical protein